VPADRLVTVQLWRPLLAGLSLAAMSVLLGRSASGSADPFAWSHSRFAPENLGLAVGSAAPDAKGTAWEGHRSVALVMPDDAVAASARAWSGLDGLQVVVFLPAVETPDEWASAQADFGDRVALVVGADATTTVRGLGISDGSAFGAIFLVDERGTIVHRLWNPSERHIPELTRIIRAFAETGAVPADAVCEQPLWRGDLAPAADFALETPSGAPAWLDAGHPRLIFCGAPLAEGQSADVRHELDQLRGEFPEVDFVWLQPYVSLETCRAMWETRQEFSWNARGLLAQPLDAYLTSCAQNESNWREMLCSFADRDAPGWRILLDRDYHLQRLWMLYGIPTVFVLDRQGRVAFPCTFYIANRASGTNVFPAGGLDALRDVLRGVML
jgi:hypothetical protein